MNLPATSTPWQNNSVIVQLLGLSPVLAVSDTLVNGIGLGIATAGVTIAACVTASMLRHYMNNTWRLLLYMVVIAFYVSLIETFLYTVFFPLYRSLGIYVPLICCNAAILYRIETFSCRVPFSSALRDSISTAFGFLWVIILLSAIREWLSFGTLLANRELLTPFINSNSSGAISTYTASANFKFPTLQPGALIVLGLIVALKNLIDLTLLRNSSSGIIDNDIDSLMVK